jgi:hypothetical protein
MYHIAIMNFLVMHASGEPKYFNVEKFTSTYKRRYLLGVAGRYGK